MNNIVRFEPRRTGRRKIPRTLLAAGAVLLTIIAATRPIRTTYAFLAWVVRQGFNVFEWTMVSLINRFGRAINDSDSESEAA